MARSFSATNDRIECGTVAIPTTGTIFCWYYPTFSMTDGAAHSPFRVRNQSAVNSSLRLFDLGCKALDNNVYSGWFNGTGAGQDERIIVAASSCYTQNTWAAAQYSWTNNGLSTFYTNGTSRGTNATTATHATTATRVIGNDGFSLTDHAGGRIAWLTLWNVVLDAAETAALAAGVCPLLIRPQSQTDCFPLLDGTINLRGGTGGTVTGTAAADHPRIYLPGGPMMLGVPGAGSTAYTLDLTGSLSLSAALTRNTAVAKSATLTLTAALAKTTDAARVGTLTPSGSLTRAVGQGLTGTLTPTGSLGKSGGKPLSGTAALSGAATNASGKGLSGTCSPSGSLAKETGKPLTGSIALSGSFSALKSVLISLTGALSLAGSLSRAIAKALSAALSLAGLLTKSSDSDGARPLIHDFLNIPYTQHDRINVPYTQVDNQNIPYTQSDRLNTV